MKKEPFSGLRPIATGAGLGTQSHTARKKGGNACPYAIPPASIGWPRDPISVISQCLGHAGLRTTVILGVLPDPLGTWSGCDDDRNEKGFPVPANSFVVGVQDWRTHRDLKGA